MNDLAASTRPSIVDIATFFENLFTKTHYFHKDLQHNVTEYFLNGT